MTNNLNKTNRMRKFNGKEHLNQKDKNESEGCHRHEILNLSLVVQKEKKEKEKVG